MKSIAFLAVTVLMLSSFTTNNVDDKNNLSTFFADCEDGYSEVSWNVTCPNGITYSGSRCFRTEIAFDASVAILSAPCPE